MSKSVVAVCVSQKKGEQKSAVDQVTLKADHGIVGDAHAGDWDRQISLLARESVKKMRERGLDLKAGAFAENILTEGISLISLPIGAQLAVGETVIEVTRIGKECHNRCAIYHQAGDCVMPREGIFARVVRGGRVRAGDMVILLNEGSRQ